MKATKVQQEKGKVKYLYDYPANREVSKWLSFEDRHQIARHTGFTRKYVDQVCRGERSNRAIETYARVMAKANQAKQRKLEKITSPTK